ncbi:arsenate reductase ArsC [candidate division KSB1 bacterium]|nr:arsenate reductase ArsC [candidate division KSB1 bacterium]
MTIKILILCTGNSCRSQMAQGFLKSFNPQLEVHSAGTAPSDRVNPFAIKAMLEVDIDISDGKPEDVGQYLDQSFDYVITVCDHAKESCPMFPGDVREQLHIGFDDPADASGSEEEIMVVFRRVRDEIKDRFEQFYREKIQE